MSRRVVALVLSGFFPGLGQLYNRQWLKGTAFAVAGVLLSWLAMRGLPGTLEALASAPPDRTVLGESGLLLAIWVWSVIDAWRVA
jgi:hypothetical protein